MRYFRFSNALELSTIGWHPQCEPTPGVNLRGPNGVFNVKRNEFPNFVPYLELNLVSNAKWTDVVSTAVPSHGYVFNAKVRSILKSQHLPPHAFYPFKINSSEGIREYFWFHFIDLDFWEYVDKPRSRLFLRSILPDKRDKILEEVDLLLPNSNLKELLRNPPRLTKYYWEKLSFNVNFSEYDLFKDSVEYETIISEKLLNALIQNNVTGYEVKPFEATSEADIF